MMNAPTEERFTNMPLLDSFLRETARLNPLDASQFLPSHSSSQWRSNPSPVSVQRKALKPFTFQDGSHVPAGNILCVPQAAVMRDEKFYHNPTEFNGFRFVTSEEGITRSLPKFTDVSTSYPLWGASKKAW